MRTLPLLLAAAAVTTACTTTPHAAPSATPTPTAPAASSSPSASASASASPTPSPSAQPRATARACGPAGASLVVRYRIEVDQSVRARWGITPAAFGAAIAETLCDARGWLRSGTVRFRQADDGPYLIGLRSRDTVVRRCEQLVGEPVSGNYSCAASAAKEVVINEGPWRRGTDGFPAGMRAYRRMVINHEVGHMMTLRHRSCPADGAPAPVMMQQSIGMNLNGRTCRPNPWPLTDELAALRAAH